MTNESGQPNVQHDRILDQLFELPKWDEKPGTEEFNNKYLKLLTDLVVTVNMRKTQPSARPKVFVARYPDSTLIESDGAVDVILATLGYRKDGPVLRSETTRPVPSDEFHRLIHDTLASEMQEGRVNPVEINNMLEDK